MHHVILRDDDTCALTPPEHLETLFRPFLARGLPVNLAVIPAVKTGLTTARGEPEQFLMMSDPGAGGSRPLASAPGLVGWLRDTPGVCLLQHGYFHDFEEFNTSDAGEVTWRLDAGVAQFREAGLPQPVGFVAPQDHLSRRATGLVARRFRVISTSWYDRSRIPLSWWPLYALKKAQKRDHWRVGQTLLFSRPVSEVSYLQPYDTILERVLRSVHSRKLTVLLTHWWEFFRDRTPDARLIGILHQLADALAADPAVRVITFAELDRDRELFERLM